MSLTRNLLKKLKNNKKILEKLLKGLRKVQILPALSGALDMEETDRLPQQTGH